LRDSDATRIVLLLALAYGIRRNVGTDGPSISLDPRHFLQSLSPRNVLWLLVVFETYMMAASGGQQFESFVENFWPAKAGVFLMPNGLFFLNPLHHLFSILTVVGWIVFVYADEAAVRVALAARGERKRFLGGFFLTRFVSSEHCGWRLVFAPQQERVRLLKRNSVPRFDC
jgi:hypothetical protein